MSAALAAPAARAAPVADWPVTEGAPGGGRYSPLDDIDRENVGALEIVWTYRHGDVRRAGWWHPDRVNRSTAFEATPVVVDGRLIFSTPFNRVIALDPATGAELWAYDPDVDLDHFHANMLISRGVAYWRDARRAEGPCARRVFLATLDARLIALDATDGTPCADFGQGGTVDLTAGIEPMIDPWEYNVTSPPTVIGDVVAVGSSIADLIRPEAPPGHVRGFDARSGARRWTFHTIPQPGEVGYDTWETGTERTGAANVWSTMTADPERGLLFLPVSTASPDFFGGDRPGANLFSDALVAVRAATGERVWHFQTVHHDLWDYDLAAPPVLLDVERDGARIDAVAQATKSGFVFAFDRDTGAPLFPVEERPVPQSDVPGEQSWPTQPFPTRPPPLVPQRLTAGDLWDDDPEHGAACREWLAGLRNEGLFTPPSERGTIVYPFTGGGANWSGAAFDPRRRLLVVPASNLAHVVTIERLADDNVARRGGRPLRGLLRGIWFALTGRGTGLRYFTSPLSGRVLFQHDGQPCTKPPWGFLVAVDLDTGTIRWRVPAGDPGSNVYGPPLVTAGGLVFHGGTREPELRVHDVESGAVLARFDLPAGLHAGPVTYKLRPDGRQFVVIAPGGHSVMGSPLGDHVIAFALPGDGESGSQ